MKFVSSRQDIYGCFIRTTHRILCACQLVGFQILANHVPLDSIHEFWTKLHIVEHEVTHNESGTKWDLEAECEELKTYFSTLNIVG